MKPKGFSKGCKYVQHKEFFSRNFLGWNTLIWGFGWTLQNSSWVETKWWVLIRGKTRFCSRTYVTVYVNLQDGLQSPEVSVSCTQYIIETHSFSRAVPQSNGFYFIVSDRRDLWPGRRVPFQRFADKIFQMVEHWFSYTGFFLSCPLFIWEIVVKWLDVLCVSYIHWFYYITYLGFCINIILSVIWDFFFCHLKSEALPFLFRDTETFLDGQDISV